MGFPWQYPGRPLSGKNPTILPNFGRPFAKNGTLTLTDSHDLASQLGGDTASSGSVTISGTVAANDHLTLTFTNGVLGSAPVSVEFTTTTTVLSDAAAGLASAVNDSQQLRDFGFWATSDAGVVTVKQASGVGNFTTLAAATSGAETFVIAQMGGGSGVLTPLQNFSFSHGGVLTNYWYGIPFTVGHATLSKMVAQGMPIA